MDKIKLLIAINIVLLSAVLFSLRSTEKTTTLSINKENFTLADTIGINRIEIGNNVLEKVGVDKWRVNDKFDVQPDRMASLFAVLGRVEIKRPVPEANLNEVKSLLNSTAFNVKIYKDGTLLKQYQLAGEKDETFARDATTSLPYIIYIPGYFVNIYSLFNIAENDWRDKRIMFTTWRTLQNLAINYNNNPSSNLNISFDSAFYKVEGISKLDSAKLYSYIQQYQGFEVERFPSAQEDLKRNLSDSSPFCVMILNDLYESRNNRLTIYPNDSTVYGISEKTGEVVQMNRAMLRNFLVSKDEFLSAAE
ncbi:MAG: hypothetical protein AAGI07_15695 [Bacteroidota bacterium]